MISGKPVKLFIEISRQNYFSPVDLRRVQTHRLKLVTHTRQQCERTTQNARVAFDCHIAAVDLPFRSAGRRSAFSAVWAEYRSVGGQNLWHR